MDRKAIVVASLGAAPSHSGSRLRSLARDADWLHVPAERCGDLDPDWLHGHFEGPKLYSLARDAAGGAARRERLRWAARAYDLVALEAPHDLTHEVLAHVPPARRLVTWRGEARHASVLHERFAQMSSVEARAYRLVCTARRPADEVVPLDFLASLGRDDTVAYAEGAGGFWSRLIAPHLGSPMVFARLGDEPSPDDVPSVAQLIGDYGLPRLERPRELFGIVGNPVLRSPSPRLHNAAHRALGRAALYLPFNTGSFASFWHEVVDDGLFDRLGMAFGGFTVVAPNKQAARGFATSDSEIVRRGDSCNVVHRRRGGWTCGTTDPAGVLDCLHAGGWRVRGQRAAVVGCGGAGRPIAADLAAAGSRVTLVNRGLERGRRAARSLGVPFVRLDEFSASDLPIVVHATTLGRCADDPLPFDPERLSPGAVLVDLVYAPGPTRLASRARARGRAVYDGYDVLCVQARRQFERMTGRELPAALAHEVIGRHAAAAACGAPGSGAAR